MNTATASLRTTVRRLRRIRAELREQGREVSGLNLVNDLRAYSTKGSACIAVIQSMIRTNRLAEHAGL